MTVVNIRRDFPNGARIGKAAISLREEQAAGDRLFVYRRVVRLCLLDCPRAAAKPLVWEGGRVPRIAAHSSSALRYNLGSLPGAHPKSFVQPLHFNE